MRGDGRRGAVVGGSKHCQNSVGQTPVVERRGAYACFQVNALHNDFATTTEGKEILSILSIHHTEIKDLLTQQAKTEEVPTLMHRQPQKVYGVSACVTG